MQLSHEKFDIVIIGGGAVGSGILLDATLRGYKAILLEKNDSNPNNIEFNLLKNGEKYIFTRNRNYFIHNNEKIEFNGVVIYTNGEVYIPRNALNKIDKK